MYRVSDDLPVEPFVGATFVQLCIGQFDLQLRFQLISDHFESIAVEGGWQLIAPDGRVSADGVGPVGAAALQGLLGETVDAAVADPPLSVLFTFDSQSVLRLVDTSEDYESFSLSNGAIV